jgi:aspartokinase/homoserine dehydrogenase 1
MKVLKFGGTSVATADSIQRVAEIVKNAATSEKAVVVVSALGGVTNNLIAAGNLAAQSDEKYKSILEEIEGRHFEIIRTLFDVHEQSSVIAGIKTMLNRLEDILVGISLVQENSPKTKDVLLGFGEMMSSTIIAKYLKAEWLDSGQLIISDNHHNNASVLFEQTNNNIQKTLKASKANVFVAPGFIAGTAEGVQTTLGRGGSDYTAAIFASAIKASVLEIWTDVSGVMTADPRKVETAYSVPRITYKEAMEMSHFGAKVIYPPTIFPVYQKNIPIMIKNTFAPQDEGTLISNEDGDNAMPIKGISSIDDIALLSLSGSGMIGVPGVSSRLFSALSLGEINIILITQASSEHSITFAVAPDAVENAKRCIDHEFELEIQLGKINPLKVEMDMSIVAIVGDRMSGQVNVSGRMFSALGGNGINIRAIAQGSSERNISAVIEKKDVQKALNVLHERHFENDNKRINLFIVGVGNVGGTLVEQIKNQQEKLIATSHIEIRVIGLANSKKMLIQESGIDLDNWKNELNDKGEKFTQKGLIQNAKTLNLRNSVLVDCTANYDIAAMYLPALESNISVVTANKIAASDKYEAYQKLKKVALKNGAHYLFETNVGAGLPVIRTINDLIHSGDRVQKIEATVSGSLNFIYNNYDGTTSFHDIVKQAQKEGYTEPDPRIDLSGVDVKRKILILARESGFKMELDDIKVKDILPKSCFEVESVDDFFEELKKYEGEFKAMVEKAQSENKKLRVIAGFDGKEATVELMAVDQAHPFYSLQGTDNVVALYTDRYASQPMVIQGAGAGAGVTAAGVFADIIRVVNY